MRHWTLPEANAALPEIEELVHRGQAAVAALREAHAHLEDLRIVPGADAQERHRWQATLDAAQEDLEAVQLHLAAMGVEVKDIELGLVDFRSRLGEHEVYLCWKEGEEEVAWWHTLDGGFARRRPVPDFTPV